MNENKKGYWVYSVLVVLFFILLIAFAFYLIYDLIIKLADKDFSNNTVIQALITLIVTVFIGGYFSKWLEIKNAKKIELFKIQREISLRVIDYATILYYHPESSEAKELLVSESSKVKLYFDDDTLKAINNFITQENKDLFYNDLMDKLKKAIK